MSDVAITEERVELAAQFADLLQRVEALETGAARQVVKKNKMTIIAWGGDLDRIWPTTILATTAAAKAALPQLAMARGGRSRFEDSPSRSITSRWSRSPKRCRALCEPDTLPVSSFTHTSPEGPNRSRGDSPRLGAKGVSRNPRPSTASPARSSRRITPPRSASDIPWARPTCVA